MSKKEKKLDSTVDQKLKKSKRKKKKSLSMADRPIICPPERAGMGAKVRIAGYAGRIAVIFAAVFGLTFFICDALRLELQELSVPASMLALVCLCSVVVFSLMRISRYGAIGGGLICVGGLAYALVTIGDVGGFVVKTALTFKNVVLTRLFKLGYYSMQKYLSDVVYTESQNAEYYLRGMFIMIAIAISAIFVFSCIDRVRVAIPASISGVIIALIFTYNISRSNWGIALLISSFTGLIVMYVYDRIFTSKSGDDDAIDPSVLFDGDERPTLPDGVLSPSAARLMRKQKAKEFRELKKKHKKEKTELSVEEELADYFGRSVKSRKTSEKKKAKTPEEKRAASDAKRAERAARRETDKQVRAVRHYDRAVTGARAAHGGFAAFGAFALAMLMLVIPAATVSGSFRTIKTIDDKMEFYREYVTALLMGNDPILDELGYENDKNNFTPHTTDASPRYYTGEKIMDIEVNYATNIYLRGWIGTDYKDGAWQSVDKETVAEYRALYGTSGSPTETMFNHFWAIMDPTVVAETDFSKKYINKSRYGFIALGVNISRVETEDALVYMPAFYRVDDTIAAIRASTSYGLYEYGTTDDLDVTFVNYFDGIYTGRHFMTELDYAVAVYAANMKNSDWAKNVAELIAQYNKGYEEAYSAIKKYAERRASGKSASLDTIVNEMFTEEPEQLVSVEVDGNEKRIYVSYPRGIALYVYNTETGEQISSSIASLTEFDQIDPITGEVEIDEKTGEPLKYTLAFAVPSLPLEIRYREIMTASEKQNLAYYYYYQYLYENFVYETYSQKPSSRIISDTLEEVIKEASTKTVSHFEYDDEDNQYTVTEIVDSGFDPVLAAERHSSNSEVYEQRNRLVMAIVDYLKENYTYTLTPSGTTNPEYDGVENFLAVTKEGYCVQFASAAALMLRQAGIPARFVEGYVACDMHRNYESDAVARYKTTVRDYNEHAWIEVWYDGIGWVQYETTATYYDDMYVQSTGEVSGGTTVRPWYDPEEEIPPEEELLDSLSSSITIANGRIENIRDAVRFLIASGSVRKSLNSIELRVNDFAGYYEIQKDFYESNKDSESYDQQDFLDNLESLIGSFESDISAMLDIQDAKVEGLRHINRIIWTIVGLLILAALIVLALIIVDRLAKAAEERRRETFERAASGDVPDEERRRMATDMIDSLRSLLAAYGTPPKPGEFADEYAERLTQEYIAVFGRLARAGESDGESATELVSDTDIRAILTSIAEEEFGNGMTVEQMGELAIFYKRLRSAAKRRLPLLKRMYYHYVKRLI